MHKFAIAAAMSLVALGMMAPVAAHEFTCGADVTPVAVGPEIIYLVDTGEGYANGWIYLENHVEEGLQRGGVGALNDTPIFIHEDTDCQGHDEPDTVIY